MSWIFDPAAKRRNAEHDCGAANRSPGIDKGSPTP